MKTRVKPDPSVAPYQGAQALDQETALVRDRLQVGIAAAECRCGHGLVAAMHTLRKNHGHQNLVKT
jgi:hypothetical protein